MTTMQVALDRIGSSRAGRVTGRERHDRRGSVAGS
jgi:hypothetical protein